MEEKITVIIKTALENSPIQPKIKPEAQENQNEKSKLKSSDSIMKKSTLAPVEHTENTSDFPNQNTQRYDFKFNELDDTGEKVVDRQSFLGKYKVIQYYVPINPKEKLDNDGHDNLETVGPNHAVKAILTR